MIKINSIKELNEIYGKTMKSIYTTDHLTDEDIIYFQNLIKDMQEILEEYVEAEKFEQAIFIRDKINFLKNKIIFN